MFETNDKISNTRRTFVWSGPQRLFSAKQHAFPENQQAVDIVKYDLLKYLQLSRKFHNEYYDTNTAISVVIKIVNSLD